MIAELPPPQIQNESAVQKNRLVETAFDSTQSLRSRWQALLLAAELKVMKEQDFQRALASKEWFLRNAALVALQKNEPQKAKQASLRILERDPALVVRSSAVEILKNHMDSRVREALWAEFQRRRNIRKDQNLWIRGQILEVLSQNPVRSEMARFAKLSQDKDPQLQKVAALAVKKIY